MYKKGISVFVGLEEYSYQDNINYLRLAKSKGYEIMFSSIHIQEAKNSVEEFQKIIDEVNNLGMKLSLDISKPMYEKIKLPKNIYALRLDYGFSLDDLIKMSNEEQFLIEINASTYTKEKLEELIKKGLNVSHIRASFNYYPKPLTGHNIEYCFEKVKMLHSFGIRVGAFLPSKVGFRPPIYEGLPTVEKHRKMDLFKSIEELKAIDIDEILFGDAYASSEELTTLLNHQTEELLVEAYPYHDFDISKICNIVYKNRSDECSALLRVGSRNADIIVEPFNTTSRKINDITIDNKLFKRYSGEINIMKENVEKDNRVNVVGYIDTTDIILSRINQGKRFILINR